MPSWLTSFAGKEDPTEAFDVAPILWGEKGVISLKRMQELVRPSSGSSRSFSGSSSTPSWIPQGEWRWQDDSISVLLGEARLCGVKVGGLIHVGAHHAEELCIYHKHRVKDILWVEAFEGTMPVLKRRIRSHPGSKVACFAAGEEEKEGVTFHVPLASHDCASLLPPTSDYKEGFRRVGQKRWTEVSVKQKRLDHFVRNMNDGVRYNVFVLDTQGGELKVLKGATGLLAGVDAIVTEFSIKRLYEDQPLLDDLDTFLAQHDFVRIQTLPTWHLHHGDALYVKREFADEWLL
jgi:FkbM family methyltransferase